MEGSVFFLWGNRGGESVGEVGTHLTYSYSYFISMVIKISIQFTVTI